MITTIDNKAIKAVIRTQTPRPLMGAIVMLRHQLASLWPVFTSHIYNEICQYGQCVIISEERSGQSQLYLEDASGKRLGAVADPLGIAQRMHEKGVGKIKFTDSDTSSCSAASIEKTLLALLSDGFQPVPGASLYCLDDIYTDTATEQGLPILSDTTYFEAQKTREKSPPPPPLSAQEFRSLVQKNRSAANILQIFDLRVAPHYSRSELRPFIIVLMNRAKDFNINDRNPDSAIKIWLAVYSLNISDEENQRIILTMMDVANRFANNLSSKEDRNIKAAIKIWLAIYKLNISAERNQRIMLTMMDVANKINEKDVESAIKIWLAVYSLNISDEENQRIILTMMDVANRIKEKDTPASLSIWLAVHELNFSNEQNQRVIRTIMDVASKSKEFCQEALDFLSGEPDFSTNPYFYARIMAGLNYYLGNFEATIQLIDSAQRPEPSLLTGKADALRKLRRFEEAITISSAIIEQFASRQTLPPEELDALESALCCRGYCYLEKGRSNASFIQPAITDFEEVVKIAQRNNSSVPPRAYTGLGYAYKALGDQVKSQQAFAQALETDPDNVKALKSIGCG